MKHDQSITVGMSSLRGGDQPGAIVAGPAMVEPLSSTPAMFKFALVWIVASAVGAVAVIGADHALQDRLAPYGLETLRVDGAGGGAGSRLRGASKNSDAAAEGPHALSPPDRQALYLVRSMLLALDQANRTQNYSVLRALGTPEFRARNTQSDLAVIFAGLRRRSVDLSEVALVTPTWHPSPRAHNNTLRLRGVMPLRAQDVSFDIQLKPVGGTWLLFGISVSTQPRQRDARLFGNGASVVRASTIHKVQL